MARRGHLYWARLDKRRPVLVLSVNARNERSWLPFWMDRMDEEWEKRGEVEAPLCRKKPSNYLRSGQLYFAAEGDEGSVPKVVAEAADDLVFYATDVPHWDHDYPQNLREMASREDLTPESRRKILRDNAHRLYGGGAPGTSRRGHVNEAARTTHGRTP